MAKYKKGNDAKYADSVAEEEECDVLQGEDNEDDLAVSTSIFNLNGKPFSAVYPKVLPRYYVEDKSLFDEFGFRLNETSNVDAEPELETSQHRMKWIAHIQFAHDQVQSELLWKHVQVEKLVGDKFDKLLRTNGIPHSLRPLLWFRFSGAAKKRQASGCSYAKIYARCNRDCATNIDGQIDKDLLRTLPTNLCFQKDDAPAVAGLRRVLKTVAFMYPDLGYCQVSMAKSFKIIKKTDKLQGMGIVAANLMLVCGEENAFWIMCALIEDILPPSFYSHSLLGLQADERVIKHLMCIHTPELVDLIKKNDIDISAVIINWLLTVFASVFPIKTLLRLWDFLFVDGSVVVFRIIIAMLKMREPDLILVSKIADECPAELFNAIVQLPSTITDANGLIDNSLTLDMTITTEVVTSLRKKYQGMLMADSGMIFEAPSNGGNLPKQKVVKRRLSKSKSILNSIFHQSLENGDDDSDPKTKNIRQTEMIVDLRNAIHQVCRHFSLCPEEHDKPITLQADYSLESHDKDRETFHRARREGKKRARALLDFQRQEEDELGFSKNDLINILSEKDEHCWIGEVNGQRGWFPAKFVEIIDERGKNYCVFGDEVVNQQIGEIVRGQFFQSFLRILHHGLRDTNMIVASLVSHPWPYIEALASALVENKSQSVNSKLTLCDTFKLDQDGKILSPEELLYRAVSMINSSHNGVGAQLDIKLRSLIIVALNEQCLHLWFEILCSGTQYNVLREKYYHSYAFLRSPAWQQIKCELRLLSQFSFNLSIDLEILEKAGTSSGGVVSRLQMLSTGQSKNGFRKSQSIDASLSGASTTNKQPLKEGVRDMLIKHHLFSWDL
uniref:RUN and TBC1 domain-containing protein 3 n=1 Tax=Panagrellus redivivus TaxID=6233 RepID=A0A7E4V5X8_PANRE